ncbi:hypothetical protein AWB77_05911 [Caballeronia fortuita]|uniref:Uncharacterized protein n=1 Tax=Caballeronia fortuita TaxID=1777138 RepID=A0A158DWD7_9BURK|nr:hypothetical protein [Caballeronia fortuita]SAK98941.1 hypothetical protein AWB77_05911 [Caballeronia fortuita]
MEFVLLLAVFLTSSGYLFNAAVQPAAPTAASAAPYPAAAAAAVADTGTAVAR